MSRIFVCLFVLFIFNIAIQFGDCKNTTQSDDKCDAENIKPASENTYLSSWEKLVKGSKAFMEKIFGKNKKSESKNEGPTRSIQNIQKFIQTKTKVIQPGNSF